MPPLTLMVKPVSGLCNMHCSYCFYRDEMARRETPLPAPMSMGTLERLIRRAMLYAEGELTLIFQGGEPLLAGKEYFRQLLQLEKKYRRADVTVRHAIQTNGLALDAEWCTIFQQGSFLVGVSLDGTGDLHDLYRRDNGGQPTSQRVMEAISLLRRENIPYNILCVVTEEMASRAKAVFHALQEHGFLQFIPCMDDGTNVPLLTSRGYGRFLIDLFDCYEQAYHSGRPVSIRTFDNWLAMACGYPPESCAMSGQCSRTSLIEADGSVYPCDFYAVDEWRLGNINDKAFSRLECSDAACRFVQPAPLPDRCRHCAWYTLCRGGCRRDREPHPESTEGISRWCDGLRMFFEQRGARLQALAKCVYAS
ncbi:MAG: SPASM domain-containing protein [bacterium]|nr:SPASM domain-containing protein [bacterium]